MHSVILERIWRYFTLSVVFSITLLWTTCSLEDVLFKTNFYWNLVDLQRCVSFQVFHVQMPLLGGYSTWLTSHWTDTRHLLFWLKQICKSKCILLLTVLFYHYQNKKGHINKRCMRFYEAHFETLLKNIKDPNTSRHKPYWEMKIQYCQEVRFLKLLYMQFQTTLHRVFQEADCMKCPHFSWTRWL